MPETVDGAARVLLDASPNAVVGVDESGVIGYLNHRAVELFGYEPDELLGRPVEHLVPEGLRATHLAHRSAWQLDPAPRARLVVSARRAGGEVVPVEVSLTPVEFEVGRWVFAAINDLRSRVATESQLDMVTRAYRTLAATNHAIVRAHDPDELFEAACRISVDVGGYLGAWVAGPGADRAVRVLACAGTINSYISQLRVTLDEDDWRGRGPTAMALRDGRPHYVSDFGIDPRTTGWHELAARYGVHASATLPLRRRGTVVAALGLCSASPYIFDEPMRGLLEGMAEEIGHALDSLQSALELREAAGHRSELLHRLVEAQERERAKIAADVHDDSVQALAAVDLRLGALHRRIQRVAPELDEDAAATRSTLAAATERLRSLLFDLEPVDTDLPLAEALHELTAAMITGSGITWSVVGDLNRDLPHAERLQAVRIVKEALTNVRHHAHASSVLVELEALGNGVQITVADDGVGIGSDAVTSPPGHRGLAGMRDRAEVSGGWLRLLDAGRGTVLRLWLPDPRVAAGVVPAPR